MFTCALMGHAAGTGSALCVKHGVTPRALGQDHIGELQQQLLKEGARVIGLRADDPRDLAPHATATASSTRFRETGETMAPGNVINGYARAVGERGHVITNAWAPARNRATGRNGADRQGDAAAHWIQLAWQEPISLNTVHVTFQTIDRALRWFAVEVAKDEDVGRDAQPAWRRIAEIDKNRHRRLVLGVDRVTTRRLRVVLREPAAICEIRVYEEPPTVVESARRALQTMRLPDEGPFFPWTE
jgi:hypothetical protein